MAAIRIVDTYAALPKGAPLATFGSFGLLEVAIRDGNAATRFGAGPGSSVSVVGPKMMDEIVAHKDAPSRSDRPFPRYRRTRRAWRGGARALANSRR